MTISREFVRMNFMDNLDMKHNTSPLIPKELSLLQKQISLDMLNRGNYNFMFMEQIITCDETWVYEFDM